MLKSYKELKVWEKGYKLCLEIYKVINPPKADILMKVYQGVNIMTITRCSGRKNIFLLVDKYKHR